MKPGRQSAILEIISHRNIETQRQLQEALAEQGIKSTQATLSRDIKDMRLVKELGTDGVYRYTVSERAEDDASNRRLQEILRESVRSYDTAANILVVKTISGLALAVSSAIDSMKIDGLVGTIAGNDTIFLAMRDEECCGRLFDNLNEVIGVR